MSDIQITDPVWAAIMADDELKGARRKLSFHEIRRIIHHAQNAGCPFCAGRATYSGDPAEVFCAEHYRQYQTTGAA